MGKDLRFFELNSGAKIPSVALGTCRNTDVETIFHALEAAVKVGYRHIDCAQNYYNEKEVGAALKKVFEDGLVKREDLWITSKLRCSNNAPEDVAPALDQTLADLQLEYVDLFLVHWPVWMKKDAVGYKPENLVKTADMPSTWKAMEALYDSGKARNIGVSNFSSKKLGDLLAVARVPPVINQVECHPVWQQQKLHEFCKSKGVHLTGFSPLGSHGSFVKGQGAVLDHPIVIKVAEQLGKTPAQVALRWGLQMGHSVLPKSVRESRIRENFDVYDWSIPDELFAKFSEIEQKKQYRGEYFVHPTLSPYKTVEELWDGEI